MSKIRNLFGFFVEQSWLLLVSAFIFGLLIALASSAWSPRIAENEKAKLDNLMGELIPKAETFDVAIKDMEITDDRGTKTETSVYKALDSSGKTIGFAFVAAGTGFADEVKLVVAVDAKCEKLFGYKVLKSNETPGFGDKIKDDFFRNQFAGAPAGKFELVKTGNAKEIDEKIVAISGATVSSTAMVKIFNTYVDEVKEQLQKKGLTGNGK
jgi:Na+-translocating ferredoxin:NAD+ oxidoreductase subunit G